MTIAYVNATHPSMGEGCKITDGEGNDLLAKYLIFAADLKGGRIECYSRDGEPIEQKPPGNLQAALKELPPTRWNEKHPTVWVSVPELRFVPAEA